MQGVREILTFGTLVLALASFCSGNGNRRQISVFRERTICIESFFVDLKKTAGKLRDLDTWILRFRSRLSILLDVEAGFDRFLIYTDFYFNSVLFDYVLVQVYDSLLYILMCYNIGGSGCPYHAKQLNPTQEII